MMRRSTAVVFFVALAGCGGGSSNPKDEVAYVAADDPKMNAAIGKARATVDGFIAALKSPKRGQSSFSVKMPVVDGANVEHMWLAPVSYDGKKLNGVVNN